MTTSAFTISRSEYVFGRPRDGVAGSAGQGSRSTSLTSVTRTLGCRSILYLRDIHVGVQRYYGAGRAWSRPQRGCFLSAVRFLNYDHVSFNSLSNVPVLKGVVTSRSWLTSDTLRWSWAPTSSVSSGAGTFGGETEV